MPNAGRKRIVVCCDGTWNTADQTHGGRRSPTNVAKFAADLAPESDDGETQRVFYLRGVGTRTLERLRGGAVGFGLSRNVREAYRMVATVFEPGDEIFLIGFSRGAFTARSTAGMIRNCGVLQREHLSRLDQAYELYRDANRKPDHIESRLFRSSFSFETRIRFIGVWDTVGALGIPLPGTNPLIRRINARWGFHDTALSSIVDAAFHAVAVDERRKPFQPTLWDSCSEGQRVEQVWFSGVHTDVGGGNPVDESQLSDLALGWMMQRAMEYGLRFRSGPAALDPDPLGPMHDSYRGLYPVLGPLEREIGQVQPLTEYVASSAAERLRRDRAYSPQTLGRYLDAGGKVVQLGI